MPSVTAHRAPSRLRRAALVAAVAAATAPVAAHAQTAAPFQACTPGSLANCATIQLASGTELGASYFEILIRNSGANLLPTSIDFLSFATGGQDLGVGVPDSPVTPTAVGSATLGDGSAWDVFVGGDAIFLSALDNHGIGGCVAGTDVDGFGQAGQTCGADAFLDFKFYTPLAYDPTAVTLADMEVTQLSEPLSAAFCSDGAGCTITPVTSTPEPGTIMLALTGFSAIGGLRFRRRRAAS